MMGNTKYFFKKTVLILLFCIESSTFTLAISDKKEQGSGSEALSLGQKIYGERSEWEKDFSLFTQKQSPYYQKAIQTLAFAVMRTEPENCQRMEYMRAFCKFITQPQYYKSLDETDRRFVENLKSDLKNHFKEKACDVQISPTSCIQIYGNRTQWEQDFAAFTDESHPSHKKAVSKVTYALMNRRAENCERIDYLKAFYKFHTAPFRYENLEEKDKVLLEHLESIYQIEE